MADRARATAVDTPRATPDDLPARLAALFDARAVAPPDRVLRLAGLDIGCACRASVYLAHVDRALPAAPDGTVPGVHITVEARHAETATSWPAWPTPHYREREVEAAEIERLKGNKDTFVIDITCKAPGASIGYRLSKDGKFSGPWQVHHMASFVPKDTPFVQVQTHRIGHKPTTIVKKVGE